MSFDELVLRLTDLLGPVRDSPLLPLALLAAFVAAGFLFISVWIVVFQTGLLVAPPWSFFLALAGATLSASLFWLLGRFGIGAFVARRAPHRVLRAVQGAGLEGIVGLRVLPLVPFTLVNVSAGALGVPYRTFLAGTVLGLLPGVFAVTLVGDRALAVLKHPTPGSIALLIAAAAFLVGTATLLRRAALRRQARQPTLAAPAAVETPAP